MGDLVKIGFVGTGSMGQSAHLKNYVQVPGCHVVALAEARPGLGRRVAQKYAVPGVYTCAEEMLAREKLDGLVVIQPFDRHLGLVAPLFASGLPILTEKPLAASVAVSEKMLAAQRAGGGLYMVGYHKRCDPAIIYAKGEIDRLKASGELGAMRFVRIVVPNGDWIQGGFNDLISSPEPVPPIPRDVAESWEDEHYRFVNFYVHQVNLFRHLFGEDYQVTFADKSGVLMAVESLGGIAGSLEMASYTTTLDWQESVLVGFERGYVKIELPAPLALNRPGRVEVLHDPGNGATPVVTVPHLPAVHAFQAQAAAFVGAIRSENSVPCGPEEALKDLRICADYVRIKQGAAC